tara:strand:- start:1061 stop:1174 length:114 start_codon:yes stop_codon:yes gene_type:complete
MMIFEMKEKAIWDGFVGVIDREILFETSCHGFKNECR